jgi:hypothetical protein
MTDGGNTLMLTHENNMRTTPPLKVTFITSDFVILCLSIKYPKMMMGAIKEIKNDIHKLNMGFTAK